MPTISQSVTKVTVLGLGPRRRARFLLSSVAAPVSLAVPPSTMTMVVPAPEVISAVSPDIFARRRHYFGKLDTFIQPARKSLLLGHTDTSVTTASLLVSTRSNIVTHRRMITSRARVSARMAMLEQIASSPGSIDVPSLVMEMDVQPPTSVGQFYALLYAAGDDGRWPPPGTFVKKRISFAGFLLEEPSLDIVVSPPGVAMHMTVQPPTLAITDNDIIRVLPVTMTMTVIAPSVVIVGAPIINVPSVTMVMTVQAPVLTLSNFGVNPLPVYMYMTVRAPTITQSSYITVKKVGRIMVMPKLQEATEELAPSFNFSMYLAAGETITGASITATVYSGSDPNPMAILSGPPAIMGNQVNQLMTGGVVGTIYELLCTAPTSAGQNLQLSCYYYVEPNLP